MLLLCNALAFGSCITQPRALLHHPHAHTLKHLKSAKAVVRPGHIRYSRKLNFYFKVTNFACANRQMRLLSCMTCSLVPSPPTQLSSLAGSTNSASQRYSYCKRRQLRWLHDQHFCIPVCGFLEISPLKLQKNRPPASKVKKARETMNLLTIIAPSAARNGDMLSV